MSKLIFHYGAMGSSKTANALMAKFNYNEKGYKVALLKPQCENRDGITKIKSRIGIEAECKFAETFLDNYNEDKVSKYSIVIVDEVQFLSPVYIDKLANIVDTYGITVICYGLKTDFKGELFEGSKRLIELADNIEEIPTICWCGKKAKFNARVEHGKVVKTGNQIVLGDNDTYTALCRKHYCLGQLT